MGMTQTEWLARFDKWETARQSLTWTSDGSYWEGDVECAERRLQSDEDAADLAVWAAGIMRPVSAPMQRLQETLERVLAEDDARRTAAGIADLVRHPRMTSSELARIAAILVDVAFAMRDDETVSEDADEVDTEGEGEGQ